MQFHFYEIDYCISYKFEIIVMLLTCVKQHSKSKFSVVFSLLECVIENYIKFYQREKMPKCLISLTFHFRSLCFCLCVISYRKNPCTVYQVLKLSVTPKSETLPITSSLLPIKSQLTCVFFRHMFLTFHSDK